MREEESSLLSERTDQSEQAAEVEMLRQELLRLRRANRDLARHAAAARGDALRAQNQLNAVRNSISWRLTSPVRQSWMVSYAVGLATRILGRD